MTAVNTRKPNLKANIAFSFISQLFCYITPLIVAPYVSRVLGPEGLGLYSHGYSYLFYFSSIAALGFVSYGTSKIATNRNDKKAYSSYFWTIFLLKLFLTVFCALIYLICLLNGAFGPNVSIGVGLALMMVLASVALDIKFLYQGLEKFGFISIFQVLSNALYLTLIFLFVKTGDDVIFYTLFKSSIDLVISIFLWCFLPKKVTSSKILWRDSFKILFASAVFFLPTILMQVGSQIDQSMIGRMCSNVEVGYYQTATKFPTLISNLTYAISPVMLSRISYLYGQNEIKQIKNNVSKAILLALFISIPATVGLFSISKFFVPLYFGEEFISSINIMKVLLICSLFSPISSILIFSYYYPRKEMKKMTLFLVAALFLNVSISFIGIKLLSLNAIGAAIGTATAEIILFVLLFMFSKETYDFKFILSDLWKIILSVLIMICFLHGFNYFIEISDIWKTVIDILIGTIVYGLSALFLKESICLFVIDQIKSLLHKRKASNI